MPIVNVNAKWVNGALVYYAKGYRHRWLDAFGSDVIKYVQDFCYASVDDTTGDLSGWTHTAVEVGAGTSVAVIDTTAGGYLKITNAANENDGVSLQMKGESFQLASGKPLYFGCKMSVSDATQSDLLLGLCITDTALLGGMTDGVYFECLDGGTTISFVSEKNSTETTNTGGTMTTSEIIYEFLWDGTLLKAWLDGTELTVTQTNIPDDEVLTPSIEFLNGAAAVKTASVNWLRVIQCR